MKFCSRYHHSALFITSIILFLSHSNKAQQKKTTIIFDLSGVLFHENESVFTKKLGLSALASYALTHFKHPGTTCLNMFEKMSTEPDHAPSTEFKFKKKSMPRCIVEWQQGKISCTDACNQVNTYINDLDTKQYFKSAKEKKIVTDIVSLIFNETIVSEVIEPIKPMIQYVQQLKKAGYKLFICANAPKEPLNKIMALYPEIFALFDDIIISSKIQHIKPNKNIFDYFFKTHNCTPEECILIDENPQMVTIAQTYGISAFVYKNKKSLQKKMNLAGIQI